MVGHKVESVASTSRSFLIELAGAVGDAHRACAAGLQRTVGLQRAERPGRQHDRDEAAVPEDIDATEDGDIVEKPTKVVLRFRRRDLLGHIGYFS